MIYLAHLTTFRADIGINPQSGCPAHTDGIDRLVLLRSDRFGRMLGIFVPVQPDKVRPAEISVPRTGFPYVYALSPY